MPTSNNWEGWKKSHGKMVQIPDLSDTGTRTTASVGGPVPTLSIQEVQNAVNNGGNAAQTNVSGTPAAATVQADAAQNAALSVNGMGNAGRGAFYGTLGAGGQIADPTAFLAAAPGVYQSPYAAAMERTMNGLLNQTPFKYDVNADGLYQQIKDNYVKQGRQAMMDTQGQSAALTGGYGNSYGAMAGQQAYQESLGNLAGMIPELQQIAWQQYQQGQDDQRNNLEAMSKLDAQEYARWADEQEKYQELLKTLPVTARGVGPGANWSPDMSGIVNAMNAAHGVGQSGNSKFVVDPNMQMALADYYAKMGGDEQALNTLWNMRNSGISLSGAPDEQVDYFVNNKLGLTRTNPKYLNGNYTVGAKNYNGLKIDKTFDFTGSKSGTGGNDPAYDWYKNINH